MSVSFTLLKANGQRFDPLPGHDDREFSISNANAAAVLDALGIEDSFSERPWPIQRFRTLLIVARRKRLGHASPAIPVTETQEAGDDACDRLRSGRRLHRAKARKALRSRE